MSAKIKRPFSPSERLLLKRVHDAETLIARLFHENQVLKQALTRKSWKARLKVWWTSVMVKFTRNPKEADNG